MSVGCDILAERTEQINGEAVRVITRARLSELTLCQAGAAGDNAFAYVVDTAFTPKPVAGLRSTTFKAAQLLHKLSRKVRSLKAQAASTYGEREERRPIRWPTLEESNRAQTELTEALQKQARASLFK